MQKGIVLFWTSACGSLWRYKKKDVTLLLAMHVMPDKAKIDLARWESSLCSE
jgi:hypothetical protein